MRLHSNFVRSNVVLWLLVAGNLAALLLLIFLAFFAIRPALGILFDHWVFAAAGGMAFSQLLLLALWTAFYDPKWPIRWLAISAILLVADLCVVMEFSSLIHWHYDSQYGPTGWADGIAYQLSVTTAGVALIVALGLTMFLHASCWPLRSMLGWRIEFAGAAPRHESARQFSIVQLFAWVGFFGVFFFLLRSLIVEEWFLGPIFFCALGSVAAAVNVLPWFVLLRIERLRASQFLLLGLILGGSMLLTWIEKEVTDFVNGGSATALMVPNFFPQYAAFNFAAAGVAALNLFILRANGARLRSFRTMRSLSARSVSVTTPGRGSMASRWDTKFPLFVLLKKWVMMSPKPLDPNTTIADIHRTRERIAADSGGTIAAILEDARRRQEKEGRPIWSGAKETGERPA